MLIGQRDRFHRSVIDGGDMDSSGFKESPAEGQPLRRVMVAADDQHREVPLRQTAEKIVQQGHSLRGGNGLVVDIACNQNSVGMLAVNDFDDLRQNEFLILDHGNLIDPFADVQVGQMDEFHRPPRKVFCVSIIMSFFGKGNGENLPYLPYRWEQHI